MWDVASNVRIRIKVAVSHINIFVLPTYIILANNQRIVDRIDHHTHVPNALYVREKRRERKLCRLALTAHSANTTPATAWFSLWIRMICIFTSRFASHGTLFLIGNVFLRAHFSLFTSSSNTKSMCNVHLLLDWELYGALQYLSLCKYSICVEIMCALARVSSTFPLDTKLLQTSFCIGRKKK